MMGQDQVFQWLKDQREMGIDEYFDPVEITKGLKNQGLSNGQLHGIRGDCFKLWMQGNGCIEMKDFDRKGITNWMKRFRIKKQYCRVIIYGKHKH